MNKREREKFIAYIGQTYNNIQIWGQYERMVDFIFDEFPKTNARFETIAQPLLSTISHALELALKENLKFLHLYIDSKQLTKFEEWTHLIKSHDLKSLAEEYKIAFNRLHKQVSADKEDKNEFSKYFKKLEELISILERNTETYRYAEKIDNDGNIVRPSIKSSKIVYFLKIKELFDELKNLFVGMPNVMVTYTDYIDFKINNPDYKKGKGRLYLQKLFYTEDFLENVKTILSETFTKVSDNLWIDSKTGSNYEIQIWDNHIFIILIRS
jgi:hypothetical protein